METIQGLHLEGERITVDHKHFIDCTLSGCLLEYGGGPVILERTLVRRCRYQFSGAASLTLRYLECLGLFPELTDQVFSGLQRLQ